MSRTPQAGPRCRLAVLFLAAASVLAGCAGEAPQEAPQEMPPNVVIIMADDLGYGDLSSFGNDRFETPRLDALVEQGLRFTDFHSNGPVCSPTRAALVTGRYQQRAGLGDVVYANFDSNRQYGLHPDAEVTFAELLEDAGYAAGVFGKWHLGYKPEYNPLHHGFDRFVGFVSGNIDYHSHVDNVGIHDWWHGLEKVHEEGYATELLTDHAVRFIEEHRDGPFVAYIAHGAPHWPYQGPADPPVRAEGSPEDLYDDRAPEHARRAYREMVRSMDMQVGRVLDTLERLDLDRRTLVLFFSDNGPTGPGSQGDLHGRKGSAWEGGHRVPAVAWWPGRIAPGTTDALAMTMDVTPTLVDLAGVPVPEGHAFDGISLRGLLLEGAALPERTVFWDWENHAAAAVRRGPWKLVLRDGELEQPALFNLADDRAEQHDVSGSHLDLADELQAAFEDWHEEVTADATPQPTEKLENPLE